MAEPVRKRMTLREFLDWEPPSDMRFELIRGVPVAMAPPKRGHGGICANVAGVLRNALRARGGGCTAHVEAGIVLPHRDDTFYVADLAVTCQPHSPGEVHIPDPVLIIEIVSPSTARNDMGKLQDYGQIPSVQEIVFVDSERMSCIVHRRFEQSRWLTEFISAPDQRLVLESCGLDEPLAEIYAGVVLADEEPGSEGQQFTH